MQTSTTMTALQVSLQELEARQSSMAPRMVATNAAAQAAAPTATRLSFFSA
ncbi:MAG: hypothetical protein HY815_06685 [Candidatus Riflebacteria bacterium]|nr:hypothetical protein [Candidatus Riflebacteria bacterium]